MNEIELKPPFEMLRQIHYCTQSPIGCDSISVGMLNIGCDINGKTSAIELIYYQCLIMLMIRCMTEGLVCFQGLNRFPNLM